MDEDREASGIPLHAETCKAGFELDDTRILKTVGRRFDRKVRVHYKSLMLLKLIP